MIRGWYLILPRWRWLHESQLEMAPGFKNRNRDQYHLRWDLTSTVPGSRGTRYPGYPGTRGYVYSLPHSCV